MKLKSNRKLPTAFGPDTRFEIRPVGPQPNLEERFEELKDVLLARRLEEIWEPELDDSVRRAAHEASALAWVTPFPLLFFPGLFDEKVDAALSIAQRQAEVRQRSQELLAL